MNLVYTFEKIDAIPHCHWILQCTNVEHATLVCIFYVISYYIYVYTNNTCVYVLYCLKIKNNNPGSFRLQSSRNKRDRRDARSHVLCKLVNGSPRAGNVCKTV